MATAALADISPIASFSPHFFLENLAVRADGSILVTVPNRKQLSYVRRSRWRPARHPDTGAYLRWLCDGHRRNRARHLLRQHGRPGHPRAIRYARLGPPAPVKPTRVLTFDQPAALNGACLLAPHVILLADSLAG